MPNGGSDCCGMCWFNARNRGHAGRRHADVAIAAYCTIRALPIATPFYTYCANHPHRCPERDSIPIGPVFIGDATGQREVWHPSPDTEEVRQHLLDLLAAIQEQPSAEYPIGIYRDEMIVWQLGEFGETRAVTDLERLTNFIPEANGPGPFPRHRQRLVVLAQAALAKITNTSKHLHAAADPPTP